MQKSEQRLRETELVQAEGAETEYEPAHFRLQRAYIGFDYSKNSSYFFTLSYHQAMAFSPYTFPIFLE